MKIRISEKNKLEMSAQRDFPISTPKKTYCIFSTQRSGSTLLSRALYDTGVAGDPIEYFNPPVWAIGCQQFQNTKLDMFEFVEKMKSRRTSPNGVFGIKTHYSQLLFAGKTKAGQKSIQNFLSGMNFIIRIRRQDKVSQAVSNAIAVKTGVWSSEDPKFKMYADDLIEKNISNYDVYHCLTSILEEEKQWDILINEYSLNTLDVWYEDLVANYNHEILKTLDYLEIDHPKSITFPPIQKQGGQINIKISKNFIDFLTGNAVSN